VCESVHSSQRGYACVVCGAATTVHKREQAHTHTQTQKTHIPFKFEDCDRFGVVVVVELTVCVRVCVCVCETLGDPSIRVGIKRVCDSDESEAKRASSFRFLRV